MSSVASVPHVYAAEVGDPDAKMVNEPDWQYPNLTGTAAPAFTTFITGALSTGSKKPVNVQGTDVVVAGNVVTVTGTVLVVVVARVVVVVVVVVK